MNLRVKSSCQKNNPFVWIYGIFKFLHLRKIQTIWKSYFMYEFIILLGDLPYGYAKFYWKWEARLKRGRVAVYLKVLFVSHRKEFQETEIELYD